QPANRLREIKAMEGANSSAQVAPEAGEEERLAHIWCSLLDCEAVSARDDFFDLGGHSLLVVRLAAEIESSFGSAIPIAKLFQTPTIEGQAKLLKESFEADSLLALVTLQEAAGPPLIVLPGIQGPGRLSQAVMRHVPDDLPVVGIDITYTKPEYVFDTIE